MGLFLFGKTEDKGILNDLTCFGRFQAGPWGSPIVPNGQPSVPWEFEIKHFTIGWFYFGKTGCYLHGKWTKDYLMIWGMFWPFSGSEGSPRVPESLKWFTINDVVCPENLGLNILLWDEFTMEQGRIHGSISHARWAGALMEVRALFGLNSAVKEMQDGPTDRGTDQPTNRRTDPHIESCVHV